MTPIDPRTIDRAHRVRQGYPRLPQFVAHVEAVRAARAARRATLPLGTISATRLAIIEQHAAQLQIGARDVLRRLAIRQIGRDPGTGADLICAGRLHDRPGAKLLGHGYSFRWGGRWKSAPGSYQASTQRIVVTAAWVRRYIATARRCATAPIDRTDGVACYMTGPWLTYGRRGVRLRRGWTMALAPITLVRRGAQSYHADGHDMHVAVRAAQAAWIAAAHSRRRAAQDERSTWVTIASLRAAGACPAGIAAAVAQVRARFGGLPIIALRPALVRRLGYQAWAHATTDRAQVIA